MSLIPDDRESALRLPLPVLRPTLLPSLPLPSLPEKHCRQEDEKEEEEETTVHLRRRARIPATEQRDPFFLTRTDLYSVCYGPAYDLLPPFHRPVDISSREASAELDIEDDPDCCSSCASNYWQQHPAAQLARDKTDHTQFPKCCVTCAASYWQHHKPWKVE